MKNPMTCLQDPDDPTVVIAIDANTTAFIVDHDAYIAHRVVVPVAALPLCAIRRHALVAVDTGFEDVPSVMRVVSDPAALN